jgi:hypothetical protein
VTATTPSALQQRKKTCCSKIEIKSNDNNAFCVATKTKARCSKTKIEGINNNVAITFHARIKKRKKGLLQQKKWHQSCRCLLCCNNTKTKAKRRERLKEGSLPSSSRFGSRLCLVSSAPRF